MRWNVLHVLAGLLVVIVFGMAGCGGGGGNSTAVATTPGAPTNVVATAGYGKATVLFTPPASTGSSSITGYTVTSNPGGFTATGVTSPLTVTGLTNGTAYTFAVTANNSAGTGPASIASNSVTTSTNGGAGTATVPGTPSNVAAAAANAQASILFTAPASNGGSLITGYTVTSSPGGLSVTGQASPLTVTGLTNGTAYTFSVTASNNIGTGPATLPSNSVTPVAPAISIPGAATVPGAPTNVAAAAGISQATVIFSPPASIGSSAITGYTATSSPGGFSATGPSSPLTVTGLDNGTTYAFTVTANNGVGVGDVSAVSNSVVPAATTATLKFAINNLASGVRVGTVQVHFNLPVGVVPVSITGGNDASGSIAFSGNAMGDTSSFGLASFTSPVVTIGAMSSGGFAGGEYITMNCAISSGTIVSVASFPTQAIIDSATDASSSLLPIVGLTVPIAVTLQ